MIASKGAAVARTRVPAARNAGRALCREGLCKLSVYCLCSRKEQPHTQQLVTHCCYADERVIYVVIYVLSAHGRQRPVRAWVLPRRAYVSLYYVILRLHFLLLSPAACVVLVARPCFVT